MLTGVTLTCFLFSYLTVWFIELFRFIRPFRYRHSVAVFGMLAGLLAHSIFLGNQLLTESSTRMLNSWFQWIVLGAWGMAVVCTILIVRNPERSIGLFLIPMILALIGLASAMKDSQPFAAQTAIDLWGQVHGVSLLLGTMFICQGLAFGVMYLLQSFRLKSKKRSGRLFQLPALEFLRSMNRLNLFVSVIALGVGLLSGVFLNLSRQGRVDWLSSGVLVSFALFIWVAVAAILEYSSKGSLGGRRSAYLSIANFVFLSVVLLLVFWASHGQADQEQNKETQQEPSAQTSADIQSPAVGGDK